METELDRNLECAFLDVGMGAQHEVDESTILGQLGRDSEYRCRYRGTSPARILPLAKVCLNWIASNQGRGTQ